MKHNRRQSLEISIAKSEFNDEIVTSFKWCYNAAIKKGGAMRAPKGFGKNYFSLAAIQAHASTTTLSQTSVRAHAHHLDDFKKADAQEEVDSPNEPLLATTLSSIKTSSRLSSQRRRCHCNIHFKHKTTSHIQRFNTPKLFIPPFKFSKASISPPNDLKKPHPSITTKETY